MALTSGAKLGPYEIQAPLGAGGMGEVYRARDPRLNRTVAIKVLPSEFEANVDRLRRFQQEATSLSALNHPNLLVIYDVGSQDGFHFLVSELLEGETLRQRLNSGPIPRRKAMEYATQIAYALAAAHDRGIVHRDLKPENIFLTRDGHLKLLDFGLAKQVSPVNLQTQTSGGTEAGVVLGTVGYMSPEQVRGQAADARSDIFAVGVVLYEMLTGNRAFQRESSVETMNAILKEEPPEIPSSERNFPPSIERMVRRCLEKLPDERFQSARDLSFALEALSNASSSEAESVLAPGERRSFTRGLIPVAALATAAIVLASVMLWPRAPVRPLKFIQITNDSVPKNDMGWPPPVTDAPLATDGTRLYFTATSRTVLPAQVSVGGGEIAPLALPFSNGGSQLMGISPDGSELLVEHFTGAEVEVPIWIVPVLGGSPRRLDDLLAHDVAWSPDKIHIALAIGDGLFILDSTTNTKRQVFSSSSHRVVIWPRWSPDAQRLRFTLEDSATSSSELWEVRADGSRAHALLPGWNKPAIECCGEWTRDGKAYVFQTGNFHHSDIWELKEGFLSSSKPTQLTSGPLSFSAPLPSPDGKALYVLGTQRRFELARVDRDTGHIAPMTVFPSVLAIDYSRDGKYVAYVTDPDGILWRSRVDGSDRVQLTYPPMMASAPRWSPDGTQIVFTAIRSGQPLQIEIVPAEGGSAQAVWPEARNQGSPSWSADGQSIFFGRLPWLESGSTNVPVIEKIDLRAHQLTEVPGSQDMTVPVVSPDGKYLAAKHTAATPESSIYNFASGKWILLGTISDYRPSWSRDSGALYVINRSGELISFSPLGKELKRVSTNIPSQPTGASLEGFWFLCVGLDGSPLTTRDQRSSQLYALERTSQ